MESAQGVGVIVGVGGILVAVGVWVVVGVTVGVAEGVTFSAVPVTAKTASAVCVSAIRASGLLLQADTNNKSNKIANFEGFIISQCVDKNHIDYTENILSYLIL